MDFQVEPGCTHIRVLRSWPVGCPFGQKPISSAQEVTLEGRGLCYGKWRLGDFHERFPHMQGFDEWYGVALFQDIDAFRE